MAEKLKKTKTGTGVQKQVLESLVAKANGIQADMDTSRGELGSAVKNAEDTHGVHRKAFKQVCTLTRMEQGKRDEYLRAFDDYRDKLNLHPDPDLFEDGGDEAKRRQAQDAKAESEAQTAENTKRLRGGIKQLDPAVH